MTHQTTRVTAIYDAIDAFQRTHRLPSLQHAQIRGLLAEHLDRALPAAVSAAVAPPTDDTHGLSVQHADALWDAVAIPGPHTPTYPEQHERVCRAVRDILDELTPARDEEADQTALRDRIAEAIENAYQDYSAEGHALPASDMADAVLAVLPEPTDKAAVLREEADRIDATRTDFPIAVQNGITWATAEMRRHAAELRRMADETATETPHTCKPGASTYYCPTSGETESDCHGGFTTCCDRPDLHQPAAGARQDQTATDEPECCAHCTHPKRDHDGRADHRAKHSPLVAGDPWCHACNAQCDYAAGARQDGAET